MYHDDGDPPELTPNQRRFLELCLRAPWHAKADAAERIALFQHFAALSAPIPPETCRNPDVQSSQESETAHAD